MTEHKCTLEINRKVRISASDYYLSFPRRAEYVYGLETMKKQIGSWKNGCRKYVCLIKCVCSSLSGAHDYVVEIYKVGYMEERLVEVGRRSKAQSYLAFSDKKIADTG